MVCGFLSLPSRKKIVSTRNCFLNFSLRYKEKKKGKALIALLLLLRVVVGFKTSCPLVGSELIGGMPSVGVFLGDPSPYLSDLLLRARSEF